MKHTQNTPWGFTLIELLVVVLIIGLVAAVALPQYQKAVVKSRVIATLPLLDAIYKAQHLFYLTNGTVADQFNKLDIQITHDGKSNKANNLIDYGTHTIELCSPRNCNGGSVKLNTKRAPLIQLEFYYNPTAPLKSKYCRAAPNDAAANKLCMSISGKQNYVKLFNWTWHAYEMD